MNNEKDKLFLDTVKNTETNNSSCKHTEINLENIVLDLCSNCLNLDSSNTILSKPEPLPSRDSIIKAIDELRSVLFPGYFGTSEINKENMKFHVGSTLDHLQRVLSEQIRRGLCFRCNQLEVDKSKCNDCQEQAVELTSKFIYALPDIQKLLAKDVQAAFEGDPAAQTPGETIFCYPGILAITNYRLAHELYNLDIPIIPRIITEYAHSITGIDIHPGAKIDEGLFIDHGTGVVIGETCIFGKRVKLYQGVTLGAKSFPKDEGGNPVKGIARHPIIEDDVTIYSNATILGRITIGKGSIIGGNVWLTHSVPPGSKVSQARLREDFFHGGGGI